MRLSQDEQKALWLPVSEIQPQGAYLKADSTGYRPLRNLFNIAQSSLRRLLQQTDEESREQHRQQMLADQTALADALLPVLTGTARDISLSGWYLWCQILQDPSLRAFEQSLAWFAVQMTEHWEHLPPQHTEDPQAEQIKLQELSLILGTGTENCLFYSALLLPVTDGIPYYHYLQCQHRGTLPDCLSHTVNSQSDARQRIDVLTQCLAHLQPLSVFFAERSAGHTVSPVFFTELLTGYRSAVMNVSGLTLSAPPVTEAQPESLPEKAASPAPGARRRPAPGGARIFRRSVSVITITVTPHCGNYVRSPAISGTASRTVLSLTCWKKPSAGDRCHWPGCGRKYYWKTTAHCWTGSFH